MGYLIKRIQQSFIATILGFLLLSLLLSSCETKAPPNINNACSIFQRNPSWYFASKKTRERWGVPISVQMALIKYESHFRATAKPPRRELFGMIPWKRQTTAYGYAQAIDSTWNQYRKESGNLGANRDIYKDATDFVGWYGYKAHKSAGVNRTDAYSLYLAYHEGISGYKRKSYQNKAWLIKTAQKVQFAANQYRNQILSCEKNITRPSIWNLWQG